MSKKTKFQTNLSFGCPRKSIGKSIDTAAFKKRVCFLLSVFCELSTEVSIRFCDEEEILSANHHFRNKKKSTDVLSFPPGIETLDAAAQESSTFQYLGDILICIPVCIAKAKKAKMSLDQMLEKMTIHGLVHLKGFDHERSDAAWSVMSGLERLIQKELVQHMGKPKWITLPSEF